MKYLHRDLELQMLRTLQEYFPDDYDPLLNEYEAKVGGGDARQIVLRQIAHLIDLGLIKGERQRVMTQTATPDGGSFFGYQISFFGIRITGAGMDFLEDDGGLHAELMTHTVRLHEDSIKALLETKIASSGLPADRKESLLARLHEMGTDGLKRAVDKLMDRGIDAAIEGDGSMIGDVLDAIF